MSEKLSKREESMWFVDAVWSIPVDGFDYSVPFDISEECKILVENIGNNIVIKIKKKKEDNPIDSEWQELKIDDLPRDVLSAGKYIFQDYSKQGEFFIVDAEYVSFSAFVACRKHGNRYRYRPRQPEKKEHNPITIEFDSELIIEQIKEGIESGEIAVSRDVEKKDPSHEDIMNGLKENIREIVENNTKEIMKRVISLINGTIPPESND